MHDDKGTYVVKFQPDRQRSGPSFFVCFCCIQLGRWNDASSDMSLVRSAILYWKQKCKHHVSYNSRSNKIIHSGVDAY